MDRHRSPGGVRGGFTPAASAPSEPPQGGTALLLPRLRPALRSPGDLPRDHAVRPRQLPRVTHFLGDVVALPDGGRAVPSWGWSLGDAVRDRRRTGDCSVADRPHNLRFQPVGQPEHRRRPGAESGFAGNGHRARYL